MDDTSSIGLFLELSEALTGFSSADLLGTGLVEAHYNEVRGIVGGRIFGRLLITWEQISRVRGNFIAGAIDKRILQEPMLGPIARNIIKMWYVGNWYQLPLAWRQRYGAHAKDVARVLSPESFREGLMWSAIGAHPPTAKSPGFGTWGEAIEGSEPL